MLCKNCGAIFMEGSPFCPNCNEPTAEGEAEKKAPVLNKGKMSGDVVLSAEKRVVMSAQDDDSVSDEQRKEKNKKEFSKKSYKLRREDKEQIETEKNYIENNKPFDYTDQYVEIDEIKHTSTEEIPKWKIKKAEKDRKRNIRSVHEIGKVQGGKILPEGLSPDEFMKLQDMSKVRFRYFLALVLCYGWIMSTVLVSILLYRGVILNLLFTLLVLGMTLLIQFKKSKVASLVLVFSSLLYMLLTYSVVGVLSVAAVTAAGILAYESTIVFDRMYYNYLETQIIPNEYNGIEK